jgi:proline-specific peptidase
MPPVSTYLDYSGRDDVLGGGARKIPVSTPTGTYRVWVKRIGNNPRLRVLLLHGGPGATHEYLEACDSFLPAAGIEYYYYDQLGSGFSDQPDQPSLWELDRFVDEVEQVRRALGLEQDSFVLYGQSWGGMLAMEYALTYQQHLRGLVISNMMASVPAYNEYAERVLMPRMDQAALAEIKQFEADGDIEHPRYMDLLMEQHYVHHVLRMPPEDWPDPVQRGFAPHQSGGLRTHAGPQRAGHQRGRQVGALGPDRGAGIDRCAGPGDRRPARHDGPLAHADDGQPPAAGAIPALSGRQSPGHVRRPAGVLRRPDRFPAGPVVLNGPAASRPSRRRALLG